MTNQALRTGSRLHGTYEYTITEQLHQGGFGITYKATAQTMVGNIPQTGTFTIKEFFIGKICGRNDKGCVTVAAENKEMFRQAKLDFKDEANILHSLKHKNIVPVNEVFEENDTVYYVMSFLGDTSLYQYVAEQGGKLPEDMAKAIISQLSSAVAYLHNRHILHLDIKPDNVMMTVNGSATIPMLIDFGQALYFEGGKPKRSKGIGGYSTGYSSLELKLGVTSFAPELDIYSLSATLMYMLTGTDPCDASEQSIHKIYKALPESLSVHTIDAIVCGMQKQEGVHLKDISAFQAVLQGGTSAISAETVERQTDLIINPRPHGSLAKKIGIAVACVAVLGIGIGASSRCTGKADKDGPVHETTQVKIKTNVDTTSTDTLKAISPTQKEERKIKANDISIGRKLRPGSTKESLPPQKSGTIDLGYATWTGGLLNGKPHGSGVMRFRSTHAIGGCTTTPHAGDYIEGFCENGVLLHGNLYQDGVKVESFIR